jgi:hypothetical protein
LRFVRFARSKTHDKAALLLMPQLTLDGKQENM